MPSLETYVLRCRFCCIWWFEMQHTRSFRDINKILLVLCTLRDAANAIVASLAGRRTIYNLQFARRYRIIQVWVILYFPTVSFRWPVTSEATIASTVLRMQSRMYIQARCNVLVILIYFSRYNLVNCEFRTTIVVTFQRRASDQGITRPPIRCPNE